MSKPKKKFYVVWTGAKPGIYQSWEECNAQVAGFPGAKYKSYSTLAEAEKAFQSGPPPPAKSQSKTTRNDDNSSPIIQRSISVDAACSGNPGNMEYRGVDTATGRELFRIGPYPDGTNNIGEFLALVHILALLKTKNRSDLPVYTDSKTAISWIQKKKCKTTLKKTPRNAIIFELIARAEKWLENNTITNPILKWNTKKWGEIPADFGRK